MPEILVLDEARERIAARLAERLPDVDVIGWDAERRLVKNGSPVDAAAIAPVAGWVSADVFGRKCLTEYVELLLGYDSVRWVQSANAGLDHPGYRRLAERGVRLSKSNAQSIPIAEYVVAHVLAEYQEIGARREAQARGAWFTHRFREIWGSTWLIVGFGHIGRGVAKRVKAFDAEVIAVRRSQATDPYADEVAALDALPGLLARADVVLLACPATEETRGVAGEAFFARMKEGALLVNVARGSLVDETALIAALDRGRPARAILDVFENEPLPAESPLWSHPGVVVTAHTSNAGHGTRGRGDELFLTNLAHFVAGEDLLDEVSLDALLR